MKKKGQEKEYFDSIINLGDSRRVGKSYPVKPITKEIYSNSKNSFETLDFASEHKGLSEGFAIDETVKIGPEKNHNQGKPYRGLKNLRTKSVQDGQK